MLINTKLQLTQNIYAHYTCGCMKFKIRSSQPTELWNQWVKWNS